MKDLSTNHTFIIDRYTPDYHCVSKCAWRLWAIIISWSSARKHNTLILLCRCLLLYHVKT